MVTGLTTEATSEPKMPKLNENMKDFNKHLAFHALYSTMGRTLTPEYLQALLKLARA